jgi:hypothetical protein
VTTILSCLQEPTFEWLKKNKADKIEEARVNGISVHKQYELFNE